MMKYFPILLLVVSCTPVHKDFWLAYEGDYNWNEFVHRYHLNDSIWIDTHYNFRGPQKDFVASHSDTIMHKNDCFYYVFQNKPFLFFSKEKFFKKEPLYIGEHSGGQKYIPFKVEVNKNDTVYYLINSFYSSGPTDSLNMIKFSLDKGIFGEYIERQGYLELKKVSKKKIMSKK